MRIFKESAGQLLFGLVGKANSAEGTKINLDCEEKLVPVNVESSLLEAASSRNVWLNLRNFTRDQKKAIWSLHNFVFLPSFDFEDGINDLPPIPKEDLLDQEHLNIYLQTMFSLATGGVLSNKMSIMPAHLVDEYVQALDAKDNAEPQQIVAAIEKIVTDCRKTPKVLIPVFG